MPRAARQGRRPEEIMKQPREDQWMKRLLPQSALSGALGACLILLLAASIHSYRSTQRLVEESGRRQHTQEVIGEIHHVLASALEVERAGRGFVLTGDARSLLR